MARTLEDCAPLLAAHGEARPGPSRQLAGRRPPDDAAGAAPRRQPLAGVRLALSPRIATALDADVADGLDAAIAHCTALGAELVAPPPPAVPLDVGDDFLDVLYAELLAYHRRFDGRRDALPPVAARVDRAAPRRATSRPSATSPRRRAAARRPRRFAGWLAEHRISALIEPTVPCVAPLRGDGYDRAGSDDALISLTHSWDWTGFPVVALPAGVGARSGLPVGVSLIGRAGERLASARHRHPAAGRARRARAGLIGRA